MSKAKRKAQYKLIAKLQKLARKSREKNGAKLTFSVLTAMLPSPNMFWVSDMDDSYIGAWSTATTGSYNFAELSPTDMSGVLRGAVAAFYKNLVGCLEYEYPNDGFNDPTYDDFKIITEAWERYVKRAHRAIRNYSK